MAERAIQYRHWTRERWRRIYRLMRSDRRDGLVDDGDVAMLKVPYRFAVQCLIDRDREV